MVYCFCMFTSLELLWLVLAFVVLWVGVFVCYAVWQAVKLIRSANDMLGELKLSIGRVEKAMHGMKAKMEQGGEHLGGMAQHVQDFVKKYRGK